jgi:hypothetical protein
MTAPAQHQVAKANPKPVSASVPAGILQRKCACGGTPGPSGECEACRKKRLGTLQRAAAGVGPSLAPSIVKDVLNSPGQPLDRATRTYMETRLGHDFGQVRVHTDSQAARSAQSVNALAYTVGRHIAFDAGQYRPETHAGRQIVAHELVHVMQQSTHGQATAHDLRIAGNDAAEHEAQRMGAAVEGGAQAGATQSPSAPVLQRILVPDPCMRFGNCPPPPPPSPVCSSMSHEAVMLTMAREYVSSQIDPSLSLKLRSISCFGGVGTCTIEFDSDVAVEVSMLLNPFAAPGVGIGLVFIKEIMPPSLGNKSLKKLLLRGFGPKCSYEDVGCQPPGPLTWTLKECKYSVPPGPGDYPTPSGDERIA